MVDELGLTEDPGNPHKPVDPGKTIIDDPKSVHGKSADEIAKEFKDAGFDTNVRDSTKGSKKATIVEIKGHPEITQIQVHPGGGRHEGAYTKISTSTKGIIKVVNSKTYKPTPGEKATIVTVD